MVKALLERETKKIWHCYLHNRFVKRMQRDRNIHEVARRLMFDVKTVRKYINIRSRTNQYHTDRERQMDADSAYVSTTFFAHWMGS